LRITLGFVMSAIGVMGLLVAGQAAQGAGQDVPTANRLVQVDPSPSLPPTITPSPTPPEPPATPTVTFTPTPGPQEYTVRAGDTCWGIVYDHGHVDPSAVDAIEAENGTGTCVSLREGQVIRVPRPTGTATPMGADLTQTAVATAAPPQVTLVSGPSFALQPYVVEAGDTLSSIAIIHDSSLQQICELNPLPGGIDCGMCNFTEPNCCCSSSVPLSAGQQINVPAPTPTPTATPTFTGNETPTMTPTHRAPQPTFPRAGQTISGAVRLTWVTAGVLAEDEHYLVTLHEPSTGLLFNGVTRQLSLDVPPEYLLNDGQSHALVWQVSVVRWGNDGLFYPVSGVVPEQPFTWTGW
ncbi:MAG: LysM peptidoglycan-binding domain-containing protein, partial [Anaerolineae bacterium]|nr:LysM peptidoglycan-binding domain-containing protein [Anaerolineae bacterium]